jgi:purine-binding chemotaxis protein CheW
MSGRHTAATAIDALPTISAVEQLRAEFDAAFGAAPLEVTEEFEDLLAIRVASSSYAIRLSDITGLYLNKHITALPGATPELLGVAGFRGAIVAIYDLRALLGLESDGACRWIVLTAPDSMIGLAFDDFEGHIRTPIDTRASHWELNPEPRHLRESVPGTEVTRPVVDVSGLVEATTKHKPPIHKEP